MFAAGGHKDPTIGSVAGHLHPLSPTFPGPLTVFRAAKNMVFHESLSQHAVPYQQKYNPPPRGFPRTTRTPEFTVVTYKNPMHREREK